MYQHTWTLIPGHCLTTGARTEAGTGEEVSAPIQLLDAISQEQYGNDGLTGLTYLLIGISYFLLFSNGQFSDFLVNLQCIHQ